MSKLRFTKAGVSFLLGALLLTSSQAKAFNWKSFVLPKKLPPSKSNRLADNDQAAALGFRIFHDARFSSNNNVRCASCHLPERHFMDGQPVSKDGIRPVKRNSPSLLNSAWHTRQFWDGRADSLWSQALGPTEHPDEMNFDRVGVAHRLVRSYRPAYEALFGAFPDLSDERRFPKRGKPGDPSWNKMSIEDQTTINEIFSNYGKVIEAYVRKVVARESPFDRWAMGASKAISREAVKGANVFLSKGCIDCHSGPLFSNEKYYGVYALNQDFGLEQGSKDYDASLFRSDGVFADKKIKASEQQLGQGQKSQMGAFRVPSLRNVMVTFPYSHDGRFSSIETAILAHERPDGKNASLSPDEVRSLVEFLGTLTGKMPGPPWAHWPDR